MDTSSEFCNIPSSIVEKVGKDLHNKLNHPIEIIKKKIYQYFDSTGREFNKFDTLNRVVSTQNNFDDLLIPKDHPSRKRTDTYYVDDKRVLRTHTSSHQTELMAKGETRFLVTGDVYRKDTVDASHYPVFHQMEGVCFTDTPQKDLLDTLTGLVKYLFPDCEYRVNNDYFPFTTPSFEIEVKYQGKWLEVLGCGVIHQKILTNLGLYTTGWAFGLGLERLAMVLFDIPDIRLFWSEHPRFLDQFKEGKVVKFTPFSELPNTELDISFWIPQEQTTPGEGKEPFTWSYENDFMEQLRDLCGDAVKSVDVFDSFIHPKSFKCSRAYHITYSPIDPDLKDPAEFKKVALELHSKIENTVLKKLSLELR